MTKTTRRDGTRDLARYRDNLQGEIDGITVYRAMARGESQPELRRVYEKLAEAEARHAAVWERRLREAGAWRRAPAPTWRARVLAAVAERFGASVVAPTMAAAERRDRSMYDTQPEAGLELQQDERSHARILTAIAEGGLSGPAIAQVEGRHRATGGNALRAGVLGINDGLVSNFGLVMGVAGAGGDTRALIVAGFAGLLAGSLSMALGEWLSVQSARELYTRQLEIERDELATAPDEEELELALIYEAKGLPREAAERTAAQIIRSPRALETMAREELAIDPEQLGGSAYVAAGTSFAMFAAGAVVPVLPFLLSSGTTALVASALLSAVALFGVGALITLITGRSALRAGARQLLIGAATAAATYLIGTLLGGAVV